MSVDFVTCAPRSSDKILSRRRSWALSSCTDCAWLGNGCGRTPRQLLPLVRLVGRRSGCWSAVQHHKSRMEPQSPLRPVSSFD
eukprot:14741-Eustigmatos_ZCMA.PRE.1